MAGMVDRAKLAKQHIVDEYLKPYAVFDQKMEMEYIDKAEIAADIRRSNRK